MINRYIGQHIDSDENVVKHSINAQHDNIYKIP